MHALAEIVKSVEKDGDTWLVVRLPKSRLKEEIDSKIITNTEMRFDDGRHISNLQRKKAYATIRDTGKSVCAGRTTRSHTNEECRASRKCITSTESLWMIARKGNHRVQHGTVNRVSQYGSKFYTSQKGGWLEPPERGRNADQQQTERETLRVGAFQKVPGVWLHGVPPDRAILREHRGRIRCCRPPGNPRGSETSRANAAL